jgi:parallel beta-helix repeat protein
MSNPLYGGDGIFLISSSNNTIRDCDLELVQFAIHLAYSYNNTVYDNTVYNATNGFYVTHSENNEISNNTATWCDYGAYLTYGANYNTVSGNNFSYSEYYSIGEFWNDYCNNISNNYGGENEPILSYHDTSGITVSDVDNAYAEIILCNVSDSLIENVTISNPTRKSDGIILHNTTNVTVRDSSITDATQGLYIAGNVSGNRIINNTLDSNDGHGIYLYCWPYGNNTIENNSMSHNGIYGMYVLWCYGNTIRNNIMNYNNRYGLYAYYAHDNNISLNTICYNNRSNSAYYDIMNFSSYTGDNNTCDTSFGWDDEGTTGCTNLCEPRISVNKTVNKLRAEAGERIGWSVNVTNLGGAGINVTMNDSNGRSFVASIGARASYVLSYTTTARCSNINNLANATASNLGGSYTTTDSASVRVSHCGNGICDCDEKCSTCWRDCGKCEGEEITTEIFTPPKEEEDEDKDYGGDGISYAISIQEIMTREEKVYGGNVQLKPLYMKEGETRDISIKVRNSGNADLTGVALEIGEQDCFGIESIKPDVVATLIPEGESEFSVRLTALRECETELEIRLRSNEASSKLNMAALVEAIKIEAEPLKKVKDEETGWDLEIPILSALILIPIVLLVGFFLWRRRRKGLVIN